MLPLHILGLALDCIWVLISLLLLGHLLTSSVAPLVVACIFICIGSFLFLFIKIYHIIWHFG